MKKNTCRFEHRLSIDENFTTMLSLPLPQPTFLKTFSICLIFLFLSFLNNAQLSKENKAELRIELAKKHQRPKRFLRIEATCFR